MWRLPLNLKDVLERLGLIECAMMFWFRKWDDIDAFAAMDARERDRVSFMIVQQYQLLGKKDGMEYLSRLTRAFWTNIDELIAERHNENWRRLQQR